MNELTNKKSTLTIYGYEEHFAVNHSVKVLRNGNFICEIGHHEEKTIELNEDCELTFKMSFRTVKVNVHKGIDRHVFLSVDRFLGGINAMVATNDNKESVQKVKNANSINSLIKTILFLFFLFFVVIMLKYSF